ncbi:MAG TPA: Ig-like domain-containing protein [Burkholderiales bacterium]|jgi:hypothetical protein
MCTEISRGRGEHAKDVPGSRIAHGLWSSGGRLVSVAFLAIVLSGCGGGGDEYDTPGIGWVEIDEPTENSSYQTDRASVMLGGTSFNPPGYRCLPPPAELPAGYHLTWVNTATGDTGVAGVGLNCLFVVVTSWEIWGIPLAMGANSITVTADDGAGNIGRDTITVTRIPDTTPPTVTSVSPANGATGVSTNVVVVVDFSDELAAATINAATMTLTTGGNPPVPATISVGAFSAALRPSSPLSGGTMYQLTLTTGVQDESGNPLAATFTSVFTTQ